VTAVAGRPDPLLVEPLERPVDATVELPGSKSITNRALVCAALAGGTSVLEGALFADDTEAMLGVLAALGLGVLADRPAALVEVAGCGGQVPPGPARADARSSGTTARFVAPLLALGSGRYRLDGSQQLRARPMADGIEGLRALGVDVREEGEPGHLPLEVRASGLRGGRVSLAADVSSQFASGLLLAAPCTDEGLRLELVTEPVSEPYLAMTVAVMRAFGAHVDELDAGRTYVVHPSGYRATRYRIEPDASAASYVFALAAMTGGHVRVPGLGRHSVQGDVRFAEVLAEMGADVQVADGYIDVRGTDSLHGVDVDLRHLSDTAPTFAVVAAVAEGPSRARGIGFIRAKESDRVGAVVTELRRLGVEADEEPDGFVVRPSPGVRLRPSVVQTYGDHRMAMSFALLGLVAAGVAVADPACVGKTFPGYWDLLDALRSETGTPGSQLRRH
jgi:3-phosphoshikimate 1-carboxyvinyltransferase